MSSKPPVRGVLVHAPAGESVPEEGRTSGRSWTLVMAAPCPWLNANGRLNRYVQADYVRRWRTASFVAAKRAGLPHALVRVRIAPTAHFHEHRRRDMPNLAPTLKAAVDGLGPALLRMPTPGAPKGSAAPGYGLIPDDNAEHLELLEAVEGPLYATVWKRYGLPKPSPVRPSGALVLVITDLSTEEPHVQQ